MTARNGIIACCAVSLCGGVNDASDERAMKTKLIEYHLERQSHFGLCLAMTKPDETTEVDYHKEKIAFHSRALTWLESLDEGLAVSAAAETQIQREYIERLNRQVNG